MRRLVRAARALLRCERGDTGLVELLIGASVMLAVSGAALVSFDTFREVDRDTIQRNAAQDRARTAVDRLARQLRNLASPTANQPQAIDRATPFDVVFQSVDPNGPNAGANVSNVRRMRWCLNSSTRRLHMQTQTWTLGTTPAIPAGTSCPAAGWTSSQVVVENVVNRIDGQERAVFAFDSAVPTDIAAVHAELFIDEEAGGPRETRLSTGVFLRNQNRRPFAAFTATRSAQGLVLNGSLSEDPEGQELTYRWFDGSTQVGTGVLFTYAVPSGTQHTLTLRVSDPAELETASAAQVVTA